VIARYQNRERLIAVCFASLCLLGSCLPLLAGYVASSATMQFGGLSRSHIGDVYTYLSAMHQGARGGWSYHLLHTPEEHQGEPLKLFYLALGKVARALGLRMVVAYQLARIAAGACLLAAIYIFVGYFMEDSRSRLVAFVVASVGGGLGWLTPFLQATGLWPESWLSVPLEGWLVEGFVFPTIQVFTHGALATGLMLITFLTILEYQRTGAKREMAKSVVLTMGVAIVQPLCLPILTAALFAYLALLAWSRRTKAHPPLEREGILSVLIVSAVSVSLALYFFLPFATNTAFRTWNAQALTPSPLPLDYLWGYGFVVPFAILGAVRIVRERREVELLLIAWVLAVIVLVYLPYLPQRRFSQGVIVPLGCLAVLGMKWFFGEVRNRSRRAFAYRLILTLTVMSSVGLVALHTWTCLSGKQPIFRPRGELEGISWLASNSAPEDTVLAASDTSMYIPAAIGHRVFWGHWCETINVEEKRRDFARFLDVETSDDWRWHFLQQYGIRYLFYGPQERKWGEFDPSLASYFRKRFETGEFAIYAVH
jgi:hypothetical protein